MEDPQQRIFEGLNGAKYFVFEEHLYKLKSNRKFSKSFLCNFQNCKCSISVNKENYDVIRKRGDHHHQPESAKISAIMCINQMKTRAVSEPTTSIHQIYR